MAKYLSLVVREVFYFFSVAIMIFIIMEIFWPNIVLAYFNLNYLLVLWLGSGLILIFKK